jgi:HSP20 family protein
MTPMALLTLRRGGAVPARRGDTQQTTADLARIDPWNDFDHMDRVFDSLFRGPVSLVGRQRAARVLDPNVEIYETPDELTAYVWAPGIPQEAFDISLADSTLSIKAERKPLFEAGENTTSHTPYANRALVAGTFSASYTLPADVDASKVKASYKDGVLTVKMPKSEAAKPKQIKVEVQNGE